MKLSEPLDSHSYLLANLDVSGFYRINYDTNNWNKITMQLLSNHKVNLSKIN